MWWSCGILLFHLIAAQEQFIVPKPKLQAFTPRGFRVSIPDDTGIQLFAFHGSLNNPLHELEAGQWNRDIIKPKDGRWVYEDPELQLKVGDVINYWIFVQVDGLGYTRRNQHWIVSSLEIENEDRIGSPGHSTGGYEVPDAKLEALHPKGLRVTIPDEPGVELFAFHGKVNVPLVHDLEAGTLSRDIIHPKNGLWVYENRDIRLKDGDTIYYWLYVIVDGLGYQKLKQKWIVTGANAEHSTTTVDSISGSTDRPATEEPAIPTAGHFPQQLNFKLPEGMELVVVVKEGRLLVKEPLPPQVAFQTDSIPPIGYCKATEICLPLPKRRNIKSRNS